MAFNLLGKLSLDASDFQRGTQQAEKSVGNLSTELDALSNQKVKLEADATQARAEVSRLTGELLEVDGMDARAEVRADIDAAKGNLAQIESEIAAVDGRRAEMEVDADVSSAQDSVGSGMDEIVGLTGLAGGAAATAFVTAFNAGMDQIQMKAKFEQEFGLVKADANRLGGEAAELYASGWGNSLDEVYGAVGKVNQRLVETGVVAADQTEKITTDVTAIADVFGIETVEAIDAVSSILLNGLAPDATAATDILIQGLQGGANSSGDLFDSIDEYSLHFDAFGLSAADMMEIYTTGMQNGARDTDKLGDAVKELRIRAVDGSEATADAYRAAGLDADEMATKILAGGDSAREAYGQIVAGLESIKDPQQRELAAIALFGTQFEDLGPKALEALGAVGSGFETSTGKTKDLTDAMSDATSELEVMWRNMKAQLNESAETFAEFVGPVMDFAMWVEENPIEIEVGFLGDLGSNTVIDSVINPIKFAGGEVERFKGKWNDTFGPSGAIALGAGETEYAASAADEFERRVRDLDSANRDLADSTADQAEADAEAEEAARERAGQVADLTEKINDLIAAQTENVGSHLDVERAVIKAREAAAEYDLVLQGVDETGKAVTLTEDEKRLAFIDATEAQLSSAQAATDYEVAQREANGETVTAAEKNAIHAESLRGVASTLAPGSPLRAQLLAYADELDGVPEDVSTTLSAETDFDKVEAYSRMINNVPNLKVTTLRAIFENVGRDQRFQPRPVDNGGAVGGIAYPGQSWLVGEQGPEIIQIPGTQPAEIIDNQTTRAMMAANMSPLGSNGLATTSSGNPGGVSSVNVNVYGAVGREEARRIGALIRDEELSSR